MRVRRCHASAFRAIVASLALAILLVRDDATANHVRRELGPIFVTVVHRAETYGAPIKPLSRWTVPVRAMVGGRQLATWKPRAEAWLTVLARASGHDIAMATEPPVNVFVLFVDGYAAAPQRVPIYRQILQHVAATSEFINLAAQADAAQRPCIWLSYREGDALESVVLMISETAPELDQRGCFYGGLLAATGVGFWMSELATLMFIAQSPDGTVGLTDYGARLLRMIYDPRLRVGMSVDETLPLLPALLAGPP